jgi:hypothetical protein
LLGDYTRNGKVDSSDYVVWRNALSSIYSSTDYANWQTHFGEHSGSGTSLAIVPEPTTATLLLLGVRRCGWQRR